MQVLPVLDLKGKLVVRGIAGQRHAYQPIRSRIAADSAPATVARAFFKSGFTDAYVADLDAIAGAEPDWKSYEEIADGGLQLLIDAGISNSERIQRFASFCRQSKEQIAVVAACESIDDTGLLHEILEVYGTQGSVFSLDLQNGRTIAKCREWEQASPLELVTDVVEIGFRRAIVLDLAAVGRNAGPVTLDLCRQVRAAYPDIEIISGGGVRNKSDVDLLCEAGCDRVLVASALHDGQIGAAF